MEGRRLVLRRRGRWALRQGGGLDLRHPNAPFSILRGHFAFYAGPLECYLDEERAFHQRGSFYGGWLTAEIVGPFKGSPGTEGW